MSWGDTKDSPNEALGRADGHHLVPPGPLGVPVAARVHCPASRGAAGAGGVRQQIAVGRARWRRAAVFSSATRRSSGQSVGRRAWFTSRATAQASATGPTCLSLSGLITERIAWICPSSTSSTKVKSTLLSRARKIAPGWPFTSCGSTVTSIRTSQGKTEASTRATLSAPTMAPGQLRGLAAAVADQLDVSGEQLPQALDVAFPERAEEPRRQFLPLPAVRLEPGAPCVHVAPRPHRELAARRLRPSHGRRDLRKAEPEHLSQHEDRALERAEPLQQQQGRHRHRVGQLGRALRVLVGVGEQRLGEPLSDVLLPPDAGRAQHVDRDPGHHGREEGLGRSGLRRGGLVAQPGFLDRVLGLAHAAEDPVGDREQQRPQLLELFSPGHASSSLKPWRHEG